LITGVCPASASVAGAAWVPSAESASARAGPDKRLRTRCEHRADINLGLLQLACALICHRHLPSF
jgi:hypothetical protein